MCGIVLTSKSQEDLKKIKNINGKVRTAQIYYVLKDNPSIKQGEFIYKFKGSVQIEGQFENNIQVGKWKYSPDKDLQIIGNYKDGKKDGEWKYFHNNDLISVMQYKNGKLNGKCCGYFENGNLACELYYLDGIRNGVRTSYFDDGLIKETIEYQQGNIHGLYKKFNRKGEIVLGIEYQNGMPYNIDINTKEQDELLFGGNLKNGNGDFIRYLIHDNTRRIISSVSYNNGQLHGSIQLYDRSGELAIRGQYKNGYMVGMWEFYMNNPDKKYAKVYSLTDQVITNPELDSYLGFLESLNHKVEKMPKFNNGSSKKFQEHIILSMQYPNEAAKKGIQDRVVTRFEVNQFGLLSDFKILEGDYEILNKEAERVIRTSPLWTPVFSDQIPVDVSYVFPIIFQL